jgi:hypothetical protein
MRSSLVIAAVLITVAAGCWASIKFVELYVEGKK